MTTSLATARDIGAALIAIKLEVPPMATLGAIAKTVRTEFLDDLSSCVAGSDSDGAARVRLGHMLTCVSEQTIDQLKSLGIFATLEDLAYVSRSLPVRFISAVGVAADAANPRQKEAKGFLDGLFAKKPWAAKAAANGPRQPQRVSAPSQPAARATTAPAAAPTPASSTVTAEREHNFRSAHVYGASFALCFNAVPHSDGSPGVMVDAAASCGPRTYDWPNAIHIMLDVREVTCALAVFRNWRKGVEFSAHGKMNDKSFVLERQGNFFFCKVAAKNFGVRAVKILPVDAHKVAMLFLEQLLLAYPGLPSQEIIAMARTINEEVPSAQQKTA